MARISARRRLKGVTNLTASDLKKQWERQHGQCPYTGWDLILPKSTQGKKRNTTRAASLDRIDSSKGYVKGNIQFVAVIANLAKNAYSEDELVEFCKAVAHNCMDLESILGGS